MASQQVATGGLPWTSLNAVTAVGTGSARDDGFAREDFGVYISTTGAPTSFSVSLEGSLDGANWFTIGTAITAAGYTAVTGYPVRMARLHLTALSGGTAPTVTGLVVGI